MDQSSQKSQRSSLWVWTTLWLTAFVDSGLIYSVLIYAVQSLPGLPKPISIALSMIVFVLAMWLGAYIAVKYVMKRSVVLKSHADKFATLAVIIPVLFAVIVIVLGSVVGGVNIYNVISSILAIIIIFFSIKRLIMTNGD